MVDRPLACRPVPFDALGGTSALFRAYAAADARLAPFFAHPRWHDPAAWRAAADAATAHPRDRDGLVDALAAQQPRYGADADARVAAAERLRDPRAVAVVTGQQVGLFGGPLYAPLKAITAIQLARRIEAETGRPAVPVFWMASEDHDLAEVDHATVGTATLRLPPLARPVTQLTAGAAGRVVLPEAIAEVVEAAVRALPETPFRADVAALLRASYAPGTTLADAFGRLTAGLFAGTGLVVLDPDDDAVKRLASDVFARAADARGAADAVNAAGERLAALGFHAQLAASAPGFFLLDDRGRLALEPAGADPADGLRLRQTGEAISDDALDALVRDHPERLSASASLRPVWEDALLPVAAYVGGPGEIAYWAQLRPVYDALGVPMPVVFPRTSATLVDAPARRALARTGLTVETAGGGDDALFDRLAAHDAALDAAFDTARAALDAAFDGLAPALAAVPEATLARSHGAARTRAAHAVTALRAATRRAERRQQSQLRTDTDRIATWLRPGGGLQERTQTLLPFVARVGPSLVAHLIDTLPLGDAAHHVVDI